MMKQNPSEESFEKLFKKSEILVTRLKYISSLYRKLDEISSMVELLDNDEQKTQLLAMIEEILSENKKWLEGDKCEQSE